MCSMADRPLADLGSEEGARIYRQTLVRLAVNLTLADLVEHEGDQNLVGLLQSARGRERLYRRVLEAIERQPLPKGTS